MAVMYACPPDLFRRQAETRQTPASDSRWVLEHRPEAAGEARRITRELLSHCEVTEETADSVLLAVSELVTNSVQHAQPPLCLGLCCDPASGRVHIEVSDGGPAAPHYDRAVDPVNDECGRGLVIIDRLAAAHGDQEQAGCAIHWADVTAPSTEREQVRRTGSCGP
jgi:anti-sigma regulatory factor (Ser/Thr protein kinase)